MTKTTLTDGEEAVTPSKEVEKGSEIREELQLVKAQLEALCQNIAQLKNKPVEDLQIQSKPPELKNSPATMEDEFPALTKGPDQLRNKSGVLSTKLPSWRDKGITSMEDLRTKITSDIEQNTDSREGDTMQQPSIEGDSHQVCQQQVPSAQQNNQELGEEEEGGWTTVSSKKSGRRSPQKQPTKVTPQDSQLHENETVRRQDQGQTAIGNENDRDGNPLIPSTQ
ncbi:unnamed protein product [Amaranthus hypochondriacus]